MNLNPFRKPNLDQHALTERQRKDEAESEARYHRVMGLYQQLLADARYQEISGEVEQALGEQLSTLMGQARKCHTCSVYAVRVDALHDLVMQPLHVAWLENQRSRIEQ